jgi:DNA-binding NarL/FixJ family response regulator
VAHTGCMPASVLIVDDHPSFRAAARRLLELEGYDVIGEAGDGTSALVAARSLHPDVILLDVQLPDMDGFEVAARLHAEGGGASVVLTSSRDWSDFGRVIGRTGACGFVPKGELSGPGLAACLTA